MKMEKNTTFRKLTLGFIFLGMVPLIVAGASIFIRFSSDIKEISIENYSQITNYFSKNMEDMLGSVDDAMGELYDYVGEDGSLKDVILDTQLTESDRRLYMFRMMRELASKSDHISSVRIEDVKGREYNLFYDQDKSVQNTAANYTRYLTGEKMVNPFGLLILDTIQESDYCVNTEDYVFVLVRNFYDISSVEMMTQSSLGTVFVDINVKEVEDIIQDMDVGVGSLYVYDGNTGRYIYSSNEKDYLGETDSLSAYRKMLVGEKGYSSKNGNWIFYEKVQDTELYSVLVLEESAVVGDVRGNAAVVILILTFALFMLLILYMYFSVRINQPITEIKQAMQEVQKGNLEARVFLTTRDEMQFIAEGFNKMVDDLQDYIEQVYVAQLYQKEAQLSALKMQIKPHYLYNTLDVIRMTAIENNDRETAALLQSLASQLRYVLSEENENITLENEMKMLREYAVIMKARYQSNMRFHINMQTDDAGLYIPKMLLQPAVENAFKHGLKNKAGEGTLVVDVHRRKKYLEIHVIDDGVGMSAKMAEQMMWDITMGNVQYTLATQEQKDSHISIGMKNVYDRIRAICGKNYGFTIQSEEGLGTIVTFRLPIWEEKPNV
ncbi:MAG: histidine kinase [Agathobacter sp.]|nr:histidine kinase [Agathobacter sp.]